MTVEDIGKIDIIKRAEDTGEVVLIISDHLEWGDERHLFLVQEKVNAYLSFIESGQILDHVATEKGDPIRIELVTKHDPDDLARDFLFDIGAGLAKVGYAFTYRSGA